MKKNSNFLIVISSILLVFIFSISVINSNNATETSASSISEKRIGWGIKRSNNNEQPDLGSINKKIIDTYEGIAMGNKYSKYVYLTFDNGYEAGYTPKILEVLKENQEQYVLSQLDRQKIDDERNVDFYDDFKKNEDTYFIWY